MKSLQLRAAAGAAGSVRLPGSKSISNRVLLIAALAKGETSVHRLLAADDTRVMLDALTIVGVNWNELSQDETRIRGAGGAFPVKRAELFLGNAGTAIRPLTAALAFCGGEFRLAGAPRMHQRPIRDLVDALHSMGARIDYLASEGFPPLAIHPAEIRPGQCVRVRGSVSSQYLSALLMAMPLAGGGTVEVEGELVSEPYVDITTRLMRQFGIDVPADGRRRFRVAPGPYVSPGTIVVEGDASAASYFLAAGAIGGGPVRVVGVGRASIQGDVRFAEVLEHMGAKLTWGEDWIEASAPRGKLRAFDLDLNHVPDAAMTAAVLALFADGPCTVRNVASWRVKESDRIAAMATELRKLGAVVEDGGDSLRVAPPARLNAGSVIDTYDDHRIAMCFSLVSLGGVPLSINDPDCVAKTFPGYFQAFAAICR